MKKDKIDFTQEKKYSAGVLAVCLLYFAVRSFFSFSTNNFVPPDYIAVNTDTVFFGVFCAVFAPVLILSLFALRAKKMPPVYELIPLVLISGLGQCRLYTDAYSGAVSFDASLVYGIMLVCTVITVLSGFHFSFLAGIIAVYFINPVFVPACCVLGAANTLVYIISEKDEKKIRMAQLGLAITLVTGIVLSIITMTGDRLKVKAFDLSCTVIAVIFLTAVVCACAVFIKKDIKNRNGMLISGALIALNVITLLSSVLFSDSLPPKQGVILAVSFTFLALFGWSADRKETAFIRRNIESLFGNKIVFFLMLAFTARACAFMFVFFERVSNPL